MFFRQSQTSDARQLRHDLVSPVTTLLCLLQEWQSNQSGQSLPPNETLCQLFQSAQDISHHLQWRDHPRDHWQKEKFNLDRFILDLANFGQKPYPAKIEIHTANLEKRYIYGNKDLLRQALHHLINNAFEAYHTAHPNREVLIYAGPCLNGVLIMISDYGHGMNWFHQFLAKVKGISFKKSRSGLGLSDAERIIREEFGGGLQFISRPHVGTAVMVYLP